MLKKLSLLGVLFVATFIITIGSVAFTASKTSAAELCTVGCVYEMSCIHFTGLKCPNPNLPYYLWAINGECLDGNPEHLCLNYFVGCCNK